MTSTGPDRVAIVTGASGGIGRACAERLAADGLAVVAHYAGNPDRAAEVVSTISGAGGCAVAAQADVGDATQVAALFDTAEREFGGVDVVVNSAGIMLLSPLVDTGLDDLDRMIRTNLVGTYLACQEAARRLRSGGAIVNFSSSVLQLALPTYTAYAATKGGVEAITLILAKELRGRDVTVNAVGPGPTATPLFLHGKSQEQIDQLAGLSPLNRLGEPADVAEVVSFLAGPARWVDGQVLYVNGGVVR